MVVKILNFYGRGLQVSLYHQNENEEALKRKTEIIGSICGTSELTVWKLEFPQPDVRMTVTDWKIIEVMLEDARKSLEGISKSVGLSVRTVGRRLTSMVEGHAVYLQGTPNFRMFAGLSCVFLVFCPDGKKKSAVDNIVLSKVRRIELSNTSSKQYSTFAMVFDNLSEADDTLKWVRRLDGVEKVKMGIMKELLVEQSWLRGEIRTRQRAYV